MIEELTPAIVLAIAGGLLSIAMEYLPWVAKGYNALEDDYQRLVMLGLIAVVAFGAYGLSCAGVIAVLECTLSGFWEAVGLFVATLIGNQSIHRVLPKDWKNKKEYRFY